VKPRHCPARLGEPVVPTHKHARTFLAAEHPSQLSWRKPTHPSPSVRQFRLLLNDLATSALRRMILQLKPSRLGNSSKHPPGPPMTLGNMRGGAASSASARVLEDSNRQSAPR
jgi:hypothetical protein